MIALADLLPLALFLFAFAFIYALRSFIAGLFQQLFSLPAGVGSALSHLLGPIEQSVMNALGHAEQGVEKIMGASWHALARQADWLWEEFRKHANLIAYIATPLALALQAIHALRALVHHSVRVAQSVPRLLKAVAREINHLTHRVKVIEHDLSKGIGEDVLPRIKSLDRELHRLTHKVIPSLRAAEAEAAGEVDNLYEWAKGKASLLGVGTFAYAVSVALAGLGLDWISCKSRSSVNGLKNCGLWNAIEDALGFLAGAFLFASVCEFLTAVSPFVSILADEIIPPLASAGAGLCQGTIGPPPPLPAVALHLPANPGVTLYTP